MTTTTLAVLVPLLPFLGSVAGLLLGRTAPGFVRPLAVLPTFAAAVLAALVAARQGGGKAIEAATELTPTGSVPIDLALYIDGFAALVAVLVGVVATCVQIYSTGYLREDPRYPSYAALVSLFTSAMLLVVYSGDLMVLLVGWEIMGMLLGLGLAVKTPMWPLHSWLPDAHTAAPTVGSVLLAGVLLKMGTYGFVRIVLPIAPDGMRIFAPYLAAFAVAGIIYGSLACLALARPGSKGDLKRLIAYSSVGHMGFVLLGIATMTPTGVNGALFANIAHGLVTGLLFFLVGALKDRYGTADLDTLAGATGAALYGRAPRLGALLAFAAVASLGLPGLAGFWGEMLALFGAFEPAEGLSRPAFLTFMAIGAFGTLLTAAYLLIVVRRVCMGGPRPAGETAIADVQGYEFAAWTPLVALTVLAGLWPAVLLGLTDPAVQQLLAGGTR
ncbi:NAD(P)H-quinone oxidoreductase chain 4 [Streptomyces narbonensis]